MSAGRLHGENKNTGKVKISANGVFERLEEMQSHNLIHLSELPVVGKIRALYQSIGKKPRHQLVAVSVEGLNILVVVEEEIRKVGYPLNSLM